MWSKLLNKKLILSSGLVGMMVLGKPTENKKKDEVNTSIYVWGNGVYIPRPSGGMSFANFTPKEIVDARNLKL